MILNIISHRSNCHTDETLTSTTTVNQSEHESKGNKVVTPHSPEIQNWNLTTRCSS